MRTTAAEDIIFGLTRMAPLPDRLAADDIAQIVQEAARFCREAILPGTQAADREGARYANGAVTTPAHYPALYRQWMEAGWQGLAAPEAHGGQGLPGSLWAAMMELALAADISFALGPLLTAGAIECLHHYGTEAQKARLLPRMVSGAWTGAMCLTEPQSGCDLGTLRTRAEPLGEGRYGSRAEDLHHLGRPRLHREHRLPGPRPPARRAAGQRAASPSSLPEKRAAGWRAQRAPLRRHRAQAGHPRLPTCIMIFEGAEAELVGEPHRGLDAMFAMMNAARLAVGGRGRGPRRPRAGTGRGLCRRRASRAAA